MKALIISLAFSSIIIASPCHYYPLNQLACVSKTEGASCNWKILYF